LRRTELEHRAPASIMKSNYKVLRNLTSVVDFQNKRSAELQEKLGLLTFLNLAYYLEWR
jgi:hypothetical protein